MSRKSFVLYMEWEDAFDNQPNEVAGELIKTIFDYVRTDEVPSTNSDIVKAMFSIIKPAIDRNIEKFDAAIEQRREAGKRSAENRRTRSNECEQPLTIVDERTRASTDSVSDSDSVSVSTEVDEKKSIKEKATRFSPPTLEEVKTYCLGRKNSVNAERFINFYESKGWFVGKNKMKDWKASVRTWEHKEEQKGGNNETMQEYIIPD